MLTMLRSFQPGGVERVALRLHMAWRGLGAEATLAVADAGGPLRDELAVTGFRALGHQASPGDTQAIATLITQLPELIRELRPDVLFCPGNAYTIVAVALRLRLRRNCPAIVAKISNDLARADMRPLIRGGYRQWLRIQGRTIERLVGMAEPMRDEIIQAMAVPSARVAIIDDPALNAADLVRLGALRSGREAAAGRRWLAVGRLAPQKNFAMLLHAFAQAAAPTDRLTILGDGPDRAALRNLAARLDIAAQFDLPGHVNPLDDWLANSDALLLSSDFEGVPAVVIEALAAGCPVIATDCSVSMRDLLDHGRLGTLVPIRDPAALSAAMAALPEETATRVAAARAQAARFTVERAASRYLNVMHEAVAARAS